MNASATSALSAGTQLVDVEGVELAYRRFGRSDYSSEALSARDVCRASL